MEEPQVACRPPPRRQDSGTRRVTFAPPPSADAAAAEAPMPASAQQQLPAQQGADNGEAPVVGPSYACSSSDSGSETGGGQRRGWYGRFKAAVKALKHEVLALYYAIHDPRTPWASKLLPWLALAYALSPLDLIPDFIPVLGFLDDMLLLPALLWIAVKLIPPEIMADARERARREPLLLHRNFVAAALVFLMWTALAVLFAHWAFRKWVMDPEVLQYEWAVLAGTGGVCAILFVTWTVTQLQHERRRRDEWNAMLNATQPLLPGGDGAV